ncbi:HlyD family efflux transporter periplasmic adaptor subunit [bacterium]|nr:HlyD family efflux transporter periplasmic adaptor subunit [bacterium]
MRRSIKIVVAVAVVAAAAAVSFFIVSSRPRVTMRPFNAGESRSISVDVMTLKSGKNRIVVEAMGRVQPSESVALQSQVSGKVVWRNPELVPGGILKKGDTAVRIEDSDFKLAVPQAENVLANAKLELRLEEGRQVVARKEYEMLRRELPEEEKELVLRKLQLESARKNVESAEAAVEKAKLDLNRTTLTVPMNAAVVSASAEVGSLINQGSAAAMLAGTDKYWVVLSVPIEKIGLLSVREGKKQGSKVTLRAENIWGKDLFRTGELVRIAADLQDNGYMAKAYVEVTDPLSLKKENLGQPRLILGTLLNAEIEGEDVDETIKISRRYVREGNKIYIVSDGIMRIVAPEFVSKTRDYVIIKEGGLDGADLITSPVSMPADGIKVKIFEAR